MNKPLTNQPYQFNWFDWFCLWYPPGWLILFNRHWQHYQSDPDGWMWVEYGLFLLPGGFYLALAIRWLRLGGRSPRTQLHQPDPAYQQAFRQEILAPIVEHYFRATVHNVEHLPQSGPVIVAMNHAGICFPWDFVGLGLLLTQQRNWFVQPLAHPLFFDHPWLKWWLPAGWATALGGVRADRQHFEAAIADKAILLYAPEGWRGLAKGWGHRYQLATFDPSFVRLSVRYQVPIVPVICMGSENLHPLSVNLQRLAHWLKLPVFPVSPLMLAFVLFPSMGVWAMQSQLHYHIQPTWYPWKQELPESALANDLPSGESAVLSDRPQKAGTVQLPNRVKAYHLADQLRSQLQRVITQLRQ